MPSNEDDFKFKTILMEVTLNTKTNLKIKTTSNEDDGEMSFKRRRSQEIIQFKYVSIQVRNMQVFNYLSK